MQEKTIKAILKKKINDWISTIEDKEIQTIIRQHSIITGGAIVSLMQNEKPKDFDIYFDDKESVKKIANFYVNWFNKNHGKITNKIGHYTKAFVLDGATKNADIEKAEGWDWGSHMLLIPPERIKIIVRSDGCASEDDNHLSKDFEDIYDVLEEADSISQEELKVTKEKYRPVFLSPNAITLSDEIQIVVRFYGDADQIHENFDFEHCTAYWKYKDNELVIPKEVYECVMNKELRYRGSKYPCASVIRTRKFIKRGWNCNAGQYLKMFFQISELDLKNIVVLEEQLIGVDSAYFMNLIASIQKRMNEDEKFQLTNDYIVSIIDKVFG